MHHAGVAEHHCHACGLLLQRMADLHALLCCHHLKRESSGGSQLLTERAYCCRGLHSPWPVQSHNKLLLKAVPAILLADHLSIQVLQVGQQLQDLLPVVGQPGHGVALKACDLQRATTQMWDGHSLPVVDRKRNPTDVLEMCKATGRAGVCCRSWFTCRFGQAASTSRQLMSASRLSAADKTCRRANCCTPCTGSHGCKAVCHCDLGRSWAWVGQHASTKVTAAHLQVCQTILAEVHDLC